MRHFLFSLLCMPSLVSAETFILPSPVTEAIIYTPGAEVIRVVPFTVPAGAHLIILRDLPSVDDFNRVNVVVDGARKAKVTGRSESLPPRDVDDGPSIAEAEARIEAIETQIQTVRDDAARARLASGAAGAKIAFLKLLGQSDGMAGKEIETLRQLSQMISEEALAAERAGLNGEIEARQIERTLTELEKDLAQAHQALDALTVEDTDRAFLAVSIEADEDTSGSITVTSFSRKARWQPQYNFYLTRGADASVRLDRSALVAQATGENWTDAALTLSTIQPDRPIVGGSIWPHVLRIEDPSIQRQMAGASYDSMAEPIIEAPVIVAANFDGYAVTYPYPRPVSVASSADKLQLDLDSLTLPAAVVARAVPSSDQTAYLEAHVTNTSGEPLLSVYDAGFYVDGSFVGKADFYALAAGDEADLPFGPVDGLRLERVERQIEGDRGFITKENEREHIIAIEITNLTEDFWPLKVVDAVPFSEQEDLNITWSATPRPDETDVDNHPGILAWNIGISPNSKQTIDLKYKVTWPVGMELR